MLDFLQAKGVSTKNKMNQKDDFKVDFAQINSNIGYGMSNLLNSRNLYQK